METGEDTRLLGRLRALDGLLRPGPAHVVANLVGVDSGDELVLGSEDEERRAVQRVRASREDRDVLVELLDPEEDLRALRTTDPVALARLDRLGPVDRLEIVEQRLRVVGDAEEPLLHEPRLDLGPAALARPVGQHLLVREHGLIVRTPLHGGALAIREAALEEEQELPLLPAVVRRVVRRERAVPVVRPANAAHRARDVLDVPLRALTRVDALLDRGVLGGQAEGVESLRVQHVHAVARTEASDDIADRVDEHVPDVQRPRGIREHLEDVALRPALLVRDVERLRVRPDALPALLDRLCVVLLHRLSHSCRGTKKPLVREAWRDRRGCAALGPWTMEEAASRAENGTRQNPPMLDLFPDSARIDADALAVGGVSAEELADRFGTPLVVYCEETIRQRAQALRAAAGAQGRVFYGTKAFPNVAVLRLLRDEGVGADVASAGELAFARRAGLSGAEIVVHGNNKDDALLRDAAEEDAPVVLDAPDEAALAAAAGVRRVLVRVTLGVDADTHEAIVTGHHGSKFGLPPAEARVAISDALASGLDVLGLHVHVGSQLPDFTAQAETIRRLAAFAPTCRDELGWEARVADLGGGFGIRHHPDDDVPEAAELARVAAATARESFVAAGLPAPEVWLEPGRCLVGRAGVTLYRVGAVKRLPGRTWVAVDGGMSDNPRPQLYDARYTALSAARAGQDPDELVSVAGMHCESGDVLIDDVVLPEPQSRRSARGAGDRRIHAGDELELQRRPPPRGDSRS